MAIFSGVMESLKFIFQNIKNPVLHRKYRKARYSPTKPIIRVIIMSLNLSQDFQQMTKSVTNKERCLKMIKKLHEFEEDKHHHRALDFVMLCIEKEKFNYEFDFDKWTNQRREKRDCLFVFLCVSFWGLKTHL